MRAGRLSMTGATALSGSVLLGAVLVLAISRAPLGSPLFFAVLGASVLAFGAMLRRAWRPSSGDGRAFQLALLFALLFRLPLAFAPVGPDSDMVRYLWDGRVQQLGYNPYSVLPSDPALAATHTAESARMPSLHARTPYPPAAQLFFRLVVAVHDSVLAMKLALVACDLLTIAVLRKWLAASGRREWLTLAYAWNPLVIIEVAHSGHVDALGALWLVAAAYWLTRRRTALASVAFVLAVTTKLLPIVLAPLFLARIRGRDAILGVVLLGLLYLHFRDPGSAALGAVPNVIAYIRFNGPVFLGISSWTSPQAAAAFALLLGLAAAVAARARLAVSDPSAWAWPMALALVCAPVIYPWYLLYLTPFLFTRATLPLLAWCFSGVAAYRVWELSRHGGRWIVPAGVQAFEYAVPVVLLAGLVLLSRSGPVPAEEPMSH
jgi:hypothetical protein